MNIFRYYVLTEILIFRKLLSKFFCKIKVFQYENETQKIFRNLLFHF